MILLGDEIRKNLMLCASDVPFEGLYPRKGGRDGQSMDGSLLDRAGWHRHISGRVGGVLLGYQQAEEQVNTPSGGRDSGLSI